MLHYCNELNVISTSNCLRHIACVFTNASSGCFPTPDQRFVNFMVKRFVQSFWIAKTPLSYLLPMLSLCVPFVDESCSPSFNFIVVCKHSNLYKVCAVAQNGIQHGQYSSFRGQNVMFCMQRYCCDINICSEEMNTKHIINNGVNKLTSCQMQTACFVHELVSFFKRSWAGIVEQSLFFSQGTDNFVKVVCTCWRTHFIYLYIFVWCE